MEGKERGEGKGGRWKRAGDTEKSSRFPLTGAGIIVVTITRVALR